MDKQKIQEYTLRISQANPTELTVILYEITLEYIDEAINLRGEDVSPLRSALACVEELQHNLHMEYELARNLNRLYIFWKQQIRNALTSGDYSGIETVKNELTRLHDSYKAIETEDRSRPVMENTQKIFSGLTYGKNSALLDNISTEVHSRGYMV